MQKIAIVTGANTGMGKETARELARLGMRVVLACRNREKAETACAEIIADTGNPAVEVLELDLASRDSVRAFVQAFTKGHSRLDVLVNNGGVSPTELSRVEGVEITIATNHLGPFLLTNLLLDALKASAPSRVVTVSSVMHKRARFDLSDFDGTRSWSSFHAYNNSKLLNVLFTAELSRRLAGSGVSATCLNPGLVKSDFFRHYTRPPFPVNILLALMGKNPAQGARTAIWLASSAEVEGSTGGYYENCRESTPSPQARDADLARRVWEASEKLSGLAAG
jgi:retinol dehydrogenase 12